MRILVCGGRDYTDKEMVWGTLDGLARIDDANPLATDVTIIHGGAQGADLLADTWAITSYAQIEHYPADWTAHGIAAGPIRNQRMLDEGKPDLVVAFPGGRGTADMVRRARRSGVPVMEIA